ncbi:MULTISPECIES: hypothetical protein [unclassified Bradyrhizobium]|uniref:hypothetical protein n=1 Tax=Bradyrhizobium sp. USDA 4541 TaxID=2817704 RepID=UPI0020A5D6F2|nr:hypothetical protein [Bradyrhizobium sp. USDA 4541]MCP1852753.1 ABC-type enterobactin transport system permease subunit [Bradyrhizobium sp. USDA 4541]
MDSSQEDTMKLREYELKLVQAWAELKYRVANTVALANIGVLATAVAFMKDKGTDSSSLLALGTGTFGLLSAGIALIIVWSNSEEAINRIITGDKPEERLKILADKRLSTIFTVFITGAVIGFGGAIASFTGYSQAIYECSQKGNPCKLRK